MARPFIKKNNMILASEDFQPVLKGGAGHDPTGVTYTTQSGVWVSLSNALCRVQGRIVTTAMTQGTLGDQVGILLPFTVANLPFTSYDCIADVRTTTSSYAAGNVNANRGTVLKNTNILLLEFDPGNAAIRPWTYALTDLGALGNTLDINFSIWFMPVGDAG